jgi:RNA polymerase sigma-70 factor (ECF subfamily)
MPKDRHRTFTPQFNAQIVLEVLSGLKSQAEVARQHKLKPELIARWKNVALERLESLFEAGEQRDHDLDRIAELERMVGRLTMKLDVEKSLGLAPLGPEARRRIARRPSASGAVSSPGVLPVARPLAGANRGRPLRPPLNPSGRGGRSRDGVKSSWDAAAAARGSEMSEDRTTAVVERYLVALAGDTPADPVVRGLLDRAVGRLRLHCAGLLHRSYPRLARPPMNLEADDLLGAVVERLLKAMREARPRTVRQFFALANRHIRWELNDLARRLDEQPDAVELREGLAPAAPSSGSALGPDARRILEAIEDLPEDEREAFDLVRIQGLTQPEAAEILGVSAATVKRRLNRGVLLLSQRLGDLRPDGGPSGP